MAFAAEHRSTNLWVKRHLIVFPAVVAHDIEPFGCVFGAPRLFGTALRAPLRRHHVALVKDLLLLLSEEEIFLTLHARSFDVRHMLVSLL